MWKNFLLLAVALWPITVAAEPLEYRFRVGEELVYERVLAEDLLGSEATETSRYETLAKWNVYPVRRNDDGSWHLVIRTWAKSLRYLREPASDGELGDWKKEPEVRFENTHLGYVDLNPDGTYSLNPTLGESFLFNLVPEMIFVPLPRHDSKNEPLARTVAASGNKYSLTEDYVDGSTVTIAGPYERPLSANYESIDKLAGHFDKALGRLQKIVVTGQSTWNTNPSHWRTTYQLVDTRQHCPEWLERFSKGAEQYFLHRSIWWKARLQAQQARTAAECRQELDRSRAELASAMDGEMLPEIREAYDGLLAMHDREADWDIEEATEREALYALPPVDWKSQTLQGQPRSRSDYNGKVVILDFWYRGCHHCILALPKIKQLFQEYQDRPVVVLGVNSDSQIEDAQHVISAYSLPYECVRNQAPTDSTAAADSSVAEADAQTISSQYTVHSWPTFLVLDQQGRVVLVVTGNAEDLVEQISSTVDGLLANPPTTP